MRIITTEEEAKLTKKHYHRRKSDLIERCSNMSVGETLFIHQEEWLSYGYAKGSKPIILISSAAMQKRLKHPSLISGMKFSTKNYNEGWVIKRIL